VRAWPPGSPLTDVPGGEWVQQDHETREQPQQIIRLTRTEPGLRAIWLAVHNEAESGFARALAARAELSEDALTPREQAAVLNGALRVSAEQWATSGALNGPTSPSLTETIRQALRAALSGLPE
jgi:hypothetical protein